MAPFPPAIQDLLAASADALDQSLFSSPPQQQQQRQAAALQPPQEEDPSSQALQGEASQLCEEELRLRGLSANDAKAAEPPPAPPPASASPRPRPLTLGRAEGSPRGQASGGAPPSAGGSGKPRQHSPGASSESSSGVASVGTPQALAPHPPSSLRHAHAAGNAPSQAESRQGDREASAKPSEDSGEATRLSRSNTPASPLGGDKPPPALKTPERRRVHRSTSRATFVLPPSQQEHQEQEGVAAPSAAAQPNGSSGGASSPFAAHATATLPAALHAGDGSCEGPPGRLSAAGSSGATSSGHLAPLSLHPSLGGTLKHQGSKIMDAAASLMRRMSSGFSLASRHGSSANAHAAGQAHAAAMEQALGGASGSPSRYVSSNGSHDAGELSRQTSLVRQPSFMTGGRKSAGGPRGVSLRDRMLMVQERVTQQRLAQQEADFFYEGNASRHSRQASFTRQASSENMALGSGKLKTRRSHSPTIGEMRPGAALVPHSPIALQQLSSPPASPFQEQQGQRSPPQQQQQRHEPPALSHGVGSGIMQQLSGLFNRSASRATRESKPDAAAATLPPSPQPPPQPPPPPQQQQQQQQQQHTAAADGEPHPPQPLSLPHQTSGSGRRRSQDAGMGRQQSGPRPPPHARGTAGALPQGATARQRRASLLGFAPGGGVGGAAGPWPSTDGVQAGPGPNGGDGLQLRSSSSKQHRSGSVASFFTGDFGGLFGTASGHGHSPTAAEASSRHPNGAGSHVPPAHASTVGTLGHSTSVFASQPSGTSMGGKSRRSSVLHVLGSLVSGGLSAQPSPAELGLREDVYFTSLHDFVPIDFMYKRTRQVRMFFACSKVTGHHYILKRFDRGALARAAPSTAWASTAGPSAQRAWERGRPPVASRARLVPGAPCVHPQTRWTWAMSGGCGRRWRSPRTWRTSTCSPSWACGTRATPFT